MAVSVASSPVDFPGGVRLTQGTITFDSSYPTAGEVVTPAQWGSTSGRSPDQVLIQNRVAMGSGARVDTLIPIYDADTGKVRLLGDTAAEAAGLDEIDSTADASAVVCTFLAFFINPGASITTV